VPIVSAHFCFIDYRIYFDPVQAKSIAYHYRILEKKHTYFTTGNGQPSKTALCHLCRHTFVPYCYSIGSGGEHLGVKLARILTDPTPRDNDYLMDRHIDD